MDMEHLLSGNTESSSTGTHGAPDTTEKAWCSFCSTWSSEQLQWSIMESESTYGSSARSTYSRADHSVNIYICYTGAHASSSCFP